MIQSGCRPTKHVKEARTWNDSKVSKAEAEHLNLNRSEPVDNNPIDGEAQFDVSICIP